jgi:hypothetical protein
MSVQLIKSEPRPKLRLIENKMISTYSLLELTGIEVILMHALNRQRSQDKNEDQLIKRIYDTLNLRKNIWDKYAKNLTVHEFDADHQSIMLDKKNLKRVVKIIEDDMNTKIKAWLANKI